MSNKVYGYIRVSTEAQGDSGLSLEAQEEKIKAYCMIHDLELVGGVSEVASAKTLKRPGLQSLLDKARAGQIDGIVILKLDRMFRNTQDALKTAQELDKAGVALHSINENLDTKSAMGRFFFTLMAAIADMERGIISERTITGLEAKKARGERLGGVEYGYAIVSKGDQNLTPRKDEQAVIEHIKIMRADEKTALEIAGALNRMGMRNRRGNEWTEQTVCYIIRNMKRERATA